MNKILKTGLLAVSLLSLSACSDYLDINESPNSPSEGNLNPDLVFPGAEMSFANSYGDFLRITGGYFAQHYSQQNGSSNYLDFSQFNMSPVRSSSTYSNLATRALQNLSTVIAMAEQTDAPGTVLAATVYRAAIYQTFVDCYGKIPYSEALDPSNLAPKYDNGEDIYAGIVNELEAAKANVSGSEKVCTNFLLPGSFAAEWVKVANALELRILMRECEAVDVKAKIAALVAENNFPESDVAWKGCWKNASGQANPFYQEEFATYFGSTQINVVLNLALFATMDDSDDARMAVFFNPNTEGKFTGGVSGTNFGTSKKYNTNYTCRPAMTFDAPVYLITRSEIEFFLAEYEARWGSAAAAKEHYEAAIRASFASAGVSGAETVLASWPWDASNWKHCIGVQKWVALSGTNNFEAWCEMRRLHYPALGSVKGSQIYDVVTDNYQPSLLVPGTLYSPVDGNTGLGAPGVLQRWPYPESSANRNPNAPATYDGDGTPLFWAK